jgi:hypothetical protein
MVGALSWGSATTADSALSVLPATDANTDGRSRASGDTGVAFVKAYEAE